MHDSDILPTLRSLEQELHTRAVRRDESRLDELLHPDFSEVGSSGSAYTKADVLARLPADADPEEFFSQDYSVQLLANDLALLTYRLAQRRHGELTRHSLRVSLWQQTSGRWQMRFHQGTPTAPLQQARNRRGSASDATTSDIPSHSGATVRLAGERDATELATLRWLDRGNADPESRPDAAFVADFMTWLRRALASGAWCAVVAEDVEGHLVGCMYLERVEKVPVPHEFSRAWGYVTHAYVRPDARNMGLGTAILRRLMNEARMQAFEFLLVWPSSSAIGLYCRVGFEQASREPTLENPPPHLLDLRGGG